MHRKIQMKYFGHWSVIRSTNQTKNLNIFCRNRNEGSFSLHREFLQVVNFSHIMSHHFTSCHIMSHHVTSCRIMSHQHLTCFWKHCQRHKGPEGWVNYQSNFFRSYHKLFHKSSASRPNINLERTTNISMKILTKLQLQILTETKPQNIDQTNHKNLDQVSTS